MFIKILTPNHNGKIELTVRDLEALIQEAVDKAVSEKCANCNRGYWYNYCDSTPIRTYPGITISGSTESNVTDNIASLNGGLTVECPNNIDGTINARIVNYTTTATSNKGE